MCFCSTFSPTAKIFPCYPIDGADMIFSYHLLPQPGFKLTSESRTSFEGPAKGALLAERPDLDIIKC